MMDEAAISATLGHCVKLEKIQSLVRYTALAEIPLSLHSSG